MESPYLDVYSSPYMILKRKSKRTLMTDQIGMIFILNSTPENLS